VPPAPPDPVALAVPLYQRRWKSDSRVAQLQHGRSQRRVVAVVALTPYYLLNALEKRLLKEAVLAN
jgi:hypothetical protein